MTKYLGVDWDHLVQEKAHWTAQEIAVQPEAWTAAATVIEHRRKRIDEWLGPQLTDPRLRIVLCGAGSSSFVGQTLAPWLSVRLRTRVEAVGTTDLVANPAMYLAEDVPTLMVSFSRSGDSPESVAGIDLANRLCGTCRHLVLTCNRGGRLARYAAGNPEVLCLVLPDRACDRGFAMTASFTSMQVSCAEVFSPDPERLARAVRSSRFAIESLAGRARSLARMPMERLVVLGAGCLRATAREACLKVLELTNGGVVALSDTPLGFRHGPKCVIDGATCVVVLVSGDAYTARYDLDLLRELDSDARAGRIVALHGGTGAKARAANGAPAAHPLTPDALARFGAEGRTETVSVAARHAGGAAPGDDFWLSLPYLVFCQMFAFFKARELGVAADDPCPSGEVNRVVQGVTIHAYPNR